MHGCLRAARWERAVWRQTQAGRKPPVISLLRQNKRLARLCNAIIRRIRRQQWDNISAERIPSRRGLVSVQHSSKNTRQRAHAGASTGYKITPAGGIAWPSATRLLIRTPQFELDPGMRHFYCHEIGLYASQFTKPFVQKRIKI